MKPIRRALAVLAICVTVAGSGSRLAAQTSDISQTTTGASVVALPLANRRPLQLVELTGAAVMG